MCFLPRPVEVKLKAIKTIYPNSYWRQVEARERRILTESLITNQPAGGSLCHSCSGEFENWLDTEIRKHLEGSFILNTVLLPDTCGLRLLANVQWCLCCLLIRRSWEGFVHLKQLACGYRRKCHLNNFFIT